MSSSDIPRFFLYGEAPLHVGEPFLHLESVDDRTRPANWNIRPHTHSNLNHVFLIRSGGGRMLADTEGFDFAGPCLMLVPAGVVHGFDYVEETLGVVLTVSDGYFGDLARRCEDVRAVFARAAVLPCADNAPLNEAFDRLARELAWTAPAHRLSVDALLATILVEALRLTHYASRDQPRALGPRAALVARFREMVEARYRQKIGVEAYAGALGASVRQLRTACLSIAGDSPLGLIQDRVLLEAKRLMLYSNMTVSETAFYLGFDDPAYFTRFFTRSCGLSPRGFRQTSQAAYLMT